MKRADSARSPSGDTDAAGPDAASSAGSTAPRPTAASAATGDDRLRRSDLTTLYRRVADALERSAALSEWHAERELSNGRVHSADVELECARRAREAARRGRALAARLTE